MATGEFGGRLIDFHVVAIDGELATGWWVDADGDRREEPIDCGYPKMIHGRLPRPGEIVTLEAHTERGEGEREHHRYHTRLPYRDGHAPGQQVQAMLLATVLLGRQRQLEERATMTTTMTLPGKIVSVGAEAKQNLVRVPVPGEERARLAPFEAGHLRDDAGGPLALAEGTEVDIEVALVPSERLRVIAIGRRGTLGEHATVARRAGEVEELEPIAATPAEELPPGLQYVDVDPCYYEPDDLKEYGTTMEKLSRKGIRVMGELIGPAGCGKTSWVYNLAARTRRPFAKFDMGTIVSPDQLLGYRSFEDGRTAYVVSQLVEALGTERAIVFLDEINRVSPSNAGPLFPLLDHTGEIWSDYLQARVTVHPSVMIFGASNRGAAFTGTFVMDEALESRFQYPVEVTYPEAKMEATILERRCGIQPNVARALVDFANDIRKKADPDLNDALERSISTRATIAVGHLIAGGMKPFAAIKSSILPRFSSEGGANSSRMTVLKILQGKFAG